MSSPESDRWRRLQEIVDAALDAPESEREALLARSCGGDAVLRADAERLLRSCGRAEAFLGQPAAELAAGLFRGEPAPVPRPPPDRIGPYRIIREAGQGGMGTVYLAERDDGQFQKRVALKLMREGSDSDGILRRFIDERQILARLDHPHIARLLDGGATTGGAPYLVMDFIEGVPIDRYCDERRLPVEGRLALFIEVCRAVQYAHQNLVVHRDLKPGNILVTATGEAKLLDFGIAKLLDANRETAAGVTRTGMRPMTPEFASPEQLRGEPVTTASDVYALGVLLYLLLSGRHPHPEARGSGYQLERAVVEAEPLPPSAGLRRGSGASRPSGPGAGRRQGEEPPTAPERRPSLPGDSREEIAASRGVTPERLERRLRGDLDAIVLRALRKEPGLRYATPDQLADDIGRHLEGRPVLARRGSRLYSASRLVRRHRVAVVAAGIVALSLVGGATATAWQARVAAGERDRARAEAATAERVSGFLEELFRVSDPTEGRGAVVTARELLDRGSARIERELAAEPEAQAALMAVMGRAYGNLGEYARAAALLEATLETQRGALGAARPEIAETLLELARVRAAQGDLATAERHAREALRLGGEGRSGSEGLGTAAALEALGEILHQKGELSRAEVHLREALALRRAVVGDRDPTVAANLNALAHLLSTRGELVAAEPLYREALRIERSELGNEHPDVGTTLNDLAVLLYRRNDYAGSEGLMREALEVQRRVLGNDHPEVAKTINNLAAVLEKQGKLADAEPLYREALELKRAALGPEHVSVTVSMSNLALLLSDRGDHAEADSLLRQSLAIRQKLLGPNHPSVASALHNVASQAHRQGDPATAERLYREVLEMRLRLLGTDHPEVAGTRLALGLLLDDRGSHRDAEPLLREALRIRRLQLQPGAWHTAQAESALGACLLAQGRRAEAEPLLRSGYATLLRERGPDDRSTRRAKESLERLD